MGAGLSEYLCRARSYRAALVEPKDVAWLLASYARDGLARVETGGDRRWRQCEQRSRMRSVCGSKVIEVHGSSFRRWCRHSSTESSLPGCCGRTKDRISRGRTRSAGAKRCGICVRRCCGRCFSSYPTLDDIELFKSDVACLTTYPGPLSAGTDSFGPMPDELRNVVDQGVGAGESDRESMILFAHQCHFPYSVS